MTVVIPSLDPEITGDNPVTSPTLKYYNITMLYPEITGDNPVTSQTLKYYNVTIFLFRDNRR